MDTYVAQFDGVPGWSEFECVLVGLPLRKDFKIDSPFFMVLFTKMGEGVVIIYKNKADMSISGAYLNVTFEDIVATKNTLSSPIMSTLHP